MWVSTGYRFSYKTLHIHSVVVHVSSRGINKCNNLCCRLLCIRVVICCLLLIIVTAVVIMDKTVRDKGFRMNLDCRSLQSIFRSTGDISIQTSRSVFAQTLPFYEVKIHFDVEPATRTIASQPKTRAYTFVCLNSRSGLNRV